MHKILIGLIIFAACSFVLYQPTAAYAQATRTWVSGVGDDANPCSRTAPCKTFAGAISKTATNGEIDVLDPGGFGAITITKSITIDGSNGSTAGVLVAGTNGIVVSVPSGSTVTLRNLDFEGSGSGISAISVLSTGVVHVQHSIIRHFAQNGINYAPNASGGQLTVEDTIITDSAPTVGFAGILVKPTSSANATVTVTNTRIADCFNGIFADGSGGGGTVHVDADHNTISNSANIGMVVSSTGGAFTGLVTNSLIDHSANTGLAVTGSAGTLRLGLNIISDNVTGAAALSGSGTLQSFKNNLFAGNGTDGTPITAVSGYSGTGQ
ncbi:MAG: right-handed parallel beta-helix repeat-containing protein [Stellaceae bacterium]